MPINKKDSQLILPVIDSSNGTQVPAYPANNAMTLANKKTPAQFGVGHAYFSDIGRLAYSDGVEWKIQPSKEDAIRKDSRMIFTALGDSLTASIGTITAGSDRCWYQYVSTMSGGYIGFVRGSHAGGYTAQQAYAQLLPAIINQVPGRKATHCGVLLGANNVTLAVIDPANTATILSEYLTTMRAIFNDLINAGIVPIVLDLPPPLATASTTEKTLYVKFNLALEKLCLDMKIKFMNIYPLLVDPTTGGLKPEYPLTVSDRHTNAAANRVQGEFVKTELLKSYPHLAKLPFVSNHLETTCAPNGLNIDGPDTLPTGWFYRFGNSSAVTVSRAAGTIGNKFVETIINANFDLRSPYVLASEGDVIEVMAKIKTSNITTGQFAVYVCQNSEQTTIIPNITAACGLSTNIDEYWMHERAVCGAGFTHARLSVSGAAINAGAVIEVEQLTLRNLTTLGLL